MYNTYMTLKLNDEDICGLKVNRVSGKRLNENMVASTNRSNIKEESMLSKRNSDVMAFRRNGSSTAKCRKKQEAIKRIKTWR